MDHNAPPHMRPAFQGPMPGQHSTGQFRGAQHILQQHGIHGTQQHFTAPDQPSSEQLAFFSIHKPTGAKSWDDAQPIHHPISSSDIRKALAKLQLNPRNSVKDTLMNLKSDSARRVIEALVKEQNDKLLEVDPTSEWFIAGLNVHKDTVKQWPIEKRIIKGIEVILKTEPASFNVHDFDDGPLESPPLRRSFEDDGAPMNQGPRIPHQPGPIMIHDGHHDIRESPIGNPPFQGHGHDQDLMPGRQESLSPPQHVQAGPSRGLHPQGGHHQGPSSHAGPHLDHQPHGPIHGPQHQGGPMPGLQGAAIPPPPYGLPVGPIKQAQVFQPPFEPHQQPISMPGGFPEPMPGPAFAPPEILNPHLLKHQKSKSKSLRHEYQDAHGPESESESGNSDSGSHFSSRSVEDGAYGYIERSRSRGRKRSKTRSRSRSGARSRSNGRDRMTKVYKVKKSHGRSRSDIENIPDDKRKSSSKNSSPRSSAAALPSQQIFNIRIDNDNDRERERNHDRGRETRTPDHDTQRNNNPVPSPGFSNPIYPKGDKFDKFDTHPISRHSSIGGSDTSGSIFDGNSSIYTSDDSVFSEPVRPRMQHNRPTSNVGAGMHLRSRAIPVPRDDTFVPVHHEPRRRQKLRFPADDYPPHRPRGSLHEHHIEPHHSPPYQRPPPSARRHNVQMPNPFDPSYPAQPSRSYAEVPPTYAYKSHPSPQRYITDGRPDSFELRAMADELDAMEYINQTRRSGMPFRRNNTRGRMGAEVDEWAYSPHERLYGGYRHV